MYKCRASYIVVLPFGHSSVRYKIVLSLVLYLRCWFTAQLCYVLTFIMIELFAYNLAMVTYV